jgi:hypothetical protein
MMPAGTRVGRLDLTVLSPAARGALTLTVLSKFKRLDRVPCRASMCHSD